MARYFDGTSDHIEIADHAALTWPGLASIAGWFRVDSNDTSAMIHGLMTWGDYFATPSFTIWYFGPNHASQANGIMVQTKDDGGNISQKTSSNDIVSLGTWHHLALTIENSAVWGKLFRFYLDGVEDWNNDYQTFDGMNAAAPWKFGDTQGAAAAHFYGDMAEWAKWDSALSTEQITALANGVRPPEVGTRPAWHMPMLGGLEEEIAGLSATNSGTAIAEHPPRIVAAGQYI